MTTNALAVSVVIPTHNRSASLRRTLDALRRQTYSLGQVEVIVVADGCVDDTVEMVNAYAAPFALSVVETPGRGAATARNSGAARAIGEWLIFIDDDIVPLPDFVEAHLRARGGRSDRVVVGYSRPVIPEDPDFYWTELRGWWEAMFGRMREHGHRYTFRDLLSGNFSLGAELFRRVGGFDTAFPNCGGEDFELGVRLLELGVTLSFAAGAIGDHHETRNLKGLFQRKHQEGRADVLIAVRHPELLSTIPLSCFDKPFSRLSRALRPLAFSNPKAGDALASALSRQLNFFERARMRNRWRRTVDVLFDHWYWRGAAEELKTPEGLTALLRRDPAWAILSGVSEPEMKIDLQQGLEAAERLLDEKRPASVRLQYGEHLIGQVPAKPGAERLRGAHLRHLLAKEMAPSLFAAFAAEKGINGVIDIDQLLTVDSNSHQLEAVH